MDVRATAGCTSCSHAGPQRWRGQVAPRERREAHAVVVPLAAHAAGQPAAPKCHAFPVSSGARSVGVPAPSARAASRRRPASLPHDRLELGVARSEPALVVRRAAHPAHAVFEPALRPVARMAVHVRQVREVGGRQRLERAWDGAGGGGGGGGGGGASRVSRRRGRPWVAGGGGGGGGPGVWRRWRRCSSVSSCVRAARSAASRSEMAWRSCAFSVLVWMWRIAVGTTR